MIAWLWNLLIGTFCNHRWEVTEERDFVEGSACVGKVVYLQCRKCGDVKRRNL